MTAHQATPSTGRGADVDPRSMLLITLDSCRHDTFVAADAPNLKAVGAQVHRVQAPSHFTYASHMAMWVGVTPGVAERAEPYLNPKFAKFFRISNGARRAYGPSAFELEGRNIVDGFRQAGYRTIGCGALGWFNPATPAGAVVTADFERIAHFGWPWSVEAQVAWLLAELDAAAGEPVFAFLNVGETHAPYWHEGASWSRDDNPCQPFQTVDRRADCAARQRACLEHVDVALAPLLARFAGASTVVTADHGDCWGEDGIWEHGVSHPATLTVPLVFRVEAGIDRARARLHAAESAYASNRDAASESPPPARRERLVEPVALDSVVTLREDLVCTEIDGEVLIVDAVSGQYHGCGATGSHIVQLLADGTRIDDVVGALMGMYNIDRQTCVEEVLAFLQALDEKCLLTNRVRE
ncbi:MAG TPA: PqqD family peptide modification chaperone [Caulobacteraceae bacterium]|nr:PqqD family peptide modification chaperone [Caulobacteraceae bacterium]